MEHKDGLKRPTALYSIHRDGIRERLDHRSQETNQRQQTEGGYLTNDFSAILPMEAIFVASQRIMLRMFLLHPRHEKLFKRLCTVLDI
jgi:hypothetical protein